MLDELKKIVRKWRYPISSPEEVGEALGFEAENDLSFDQFVAKLSDPAYSPKRLKKYMDRDQAEQAFSRAFKKEKFNQETLFYFYFNEGWMEFDLHFDNASRLRRVYLRHKHIDHDMGLELPLEVDNNR